MISEWVLNRFIDGTGLFQHPVAYASANTFTISGDFTSLLKKGTKVELKNGANVYYSYIASTSYGASVTTVTLTAINNTSRSVVTLSNTTITDVYFGNTPTLRSHPQYINYTIAVTGFSADPANIIARFRIDGCKCEIQVRMPNTGTSNATTFTATAPIISATVTNMVWFGIGIEATDAGVDLTNPSRIQLPSGSSTISLFKTAAAGVWTNTGVKRSSISLFYEI